MTGSYTFSSTWMLPLLLPLFITSIHSAPFHEEFDKDLQRFNTSVKDCGSCSSSRDECRCFSYNISTMSGKDCGFPDFFIKSLEGLHPTLPHVQMMIRGLKIMIDNKDPALNNTSFCSQSANPVISPVCLHKKLDHVKSYINDKNTNSKDSSSNPYVPVKC